MKRKASIDIGTNSTRLLLAEMEEFSGRVIPVKMEERITRLGDGFDPYGNLSDQAMQRVYRVIEEYKLMANKMGISEFHAIATSATRDAKNQEFFLKRIGSILGSSCQVLSGDEEARLSYMGAVSDLTKDGHILVVDIGGGSTEFIFGTRHKSLFTKSLDIGSRRLHNLFIKSDPVNSDEIGILHEFLNNEMKKYLAAFPSQVNQCISLGGTATTLGMMDAGIRISEANKVHSHDLTLANLEELIHELTYKSIQDRKNIIGLNPDRADVILAGALILQAILTFFNLNKTTTSIRDLLFGVLF